MVYTHRLARRYAGCRQVRFVRMDKATRSVTIHHAFRPVWVMVYHDAVAIALGACALGVGEVPDAVEVPR